MKPEKVSLKQKAIQKKLSRAIELLDEKIDRIHTKAKETMDLLERQRSALQRKLDDTIGKLQLKCSHKFEQMIGHPPVLHCLCGLPKP